MFSVQSDMTEIEWDERISINLYQLTNLYGQYLGRTC